MVLGAWSICIWHATSKKSPFCCIPPNCRGYCSPIKAHNCKADVYSERVSDCYSVKICSSRNDQSRKRPLIVFDGSSSNSGPLKVKKPEGATSSGAADRLKPPPAANLTNPIRKLSSSSMMSSSSSLHRSTVSTNLKQEGNTSVGASYSVFSVNLLVVCWVETSQCGFHHHVTQWWKHVEAVCSYLPFLLLLIFISKSCFCYETFIFSYLFCTSFRRR